MFVLFLGKKNIVHAVKLVNAKYKGNLWEDFWHTRFLESKFLVKVGLGTFRIGEP
jgi:hypothetical protein